MTSRKPCGSFGAKPITWSSSSYRVWVRRCWSATFHGLMRRPVLTQKQFSRAEARLRALPMTLFVGEPAVMGETVMTEAELRVYIDAFTRTGFAGPLNWYRNLRANWLDTANTAAHLAA